MSHRTTTEKLERDRERIAKARHTLALIDERMAQAQAAVEKGDDLLVGADRGLELTEETTAKAHRMAPRVAFIAIGVALAVGIVIVIRRRRSAKDDLDA